MSLVSTRVSLDPTSLVKVLLQDNRTHLIIPLFSLSQGHLQWLSHSYCESEAMALLDLLHQSLELRLCLAHGKRVQER